MSEYKKIQRVLARARTLCEALECVDVGHRPMSPSATEDREFDVRFDALVAVETVLGHLRQELVTANELLQIRFLREARCGALRKPH